jgi:dTDP-4-amino-4,6-dideoxygalactose transaminase
MTGKLAIHGGPRTVPKGLKKVWPEITQEDRDAVLAVLNRSILAGLDGPEMQALEREWAEFTGSRFALSFNSGTAALHSALYAAGVGPGDEVVTSAFSFSGSFHPILQQNAIPVFVDIDPYTYNIDVGQIEAKISDRAKVLMPVHIHGLPADMDEVMALAEQYGLIVIEDACQAHGATYQGRMAGSIGHMGGFSLNKTKNLSGGEGGLLTTDDGDFAERAKMLRTFGERFDQNGAGQVPASGGSIRPYDSYTIGWNYRTQELPAAFARSQLKRLPHYNAIAQRNGQYLSQSLSAVQGLIPPHVPPDRTTVYHKYRIRFDPEALGLAMPAVELRDRLLAALQAEGVEVTLWHLAPMTSFPIFQRLDEGYGHGCPWSCPFYGREIRYDPQEYPEAIRLLETSLVVNTEPYPIFVQDLELMEYYVKAFRKVFENLDEVAG